MATRLEIPEDTEVEEDGQSFAMNPLVLQDSRTMQFSFYGPNLLKSFRVLSLILWYYDTSTISLHQIQLQAMYSMHGEDEDIYDEWGHHSSKMVMVDFLLPTGIFIPMNVRRASTISDIKKDSDIYAVVFHQMVFNSLCRVLPHNCNAPASLDYRLVLCRCVHWGNGYLRLDEELWDEAVHYPLFAELTAPEMYVFMYVTCLGDTEEIVTEFKRLSEINLPTEIPMLKLVKREGNIEQIRIGQEIKTLAGIKNEDEINKDFEKAHFRMKMRKRAAAAVGRREKLHWKELLEHHHPPTIEPILNERFCFLREFGNLKVSYEKFDMDAIRVNPKWSSANLTLEVVDHCLRSRVPLPTNNPEDYVLKGSGSEYVVGNYELCDYKILRPQLIKKVHGHDSTPTETIHLRLLHVKSVRPNLPHSTFGFERLKLDDIPPLPGRRYNSMSLWSCETQFQVKVLRTGNINLNMERKKLVIHIGLVHGMDTLCNTCYTNNLQDGGGTEQKWDEILHFDILTQNLPRNSRICIAVCAIDRRKEAKKNVKKPKNDKADKRYSNVIAAQYSNSTPLLWVNMNLFDYQGILKAGTHKLTCWPWPDNMDKDMLNLRGVTVCNPEDLAPFIEISLVEHQSPLEYPPYDEVLTEAARIMSSGREVLQNASKMHLAQLHEIMAKSSHEEPPDEQDKELLWTLRMDCRDQYPENVSRLLSAVKWNSYKHVAQMQSLLSSWPHLDPDYALELLDCHYADQQLRKFAVESLKPLKDDQLQQYLLQLVQVIKYEPYIDNPLVEFLLDRAWRNRKVGHYLFWHLKSELSNPLVSGRFSLILEAYLYGNITHIDCLDRQHAALLKMKSLNELVKSSNIKQNDVSKQGKVAMQQCMNQASYSNALSNVECPLDPGIILEKIEVETCKVMKSKMRPLWLVFGNSDVLCKHYSVIYKNGDDLRQDMLTLQIISIMDSLWKAEGLDLQMIPYGCLSTGEKQGMIEVVTQANTIANIQKQKAGRFTSAFKHDSLFDWIKSKNETPEALESAIRNFTYSCAGYCVATYVLGVGDRHSDNIMVTERGQLFHIDFGHILGNFKTKYGIKRERVPFVLAHDFVHVINKGKTDTKEEFENFRKLCDHAFKVLRQRGHLFISLFSLMLSSGLPELTSEEDLEYIRGSLALHASEAQAEKQFRQKFNLATKDAWATSVNWFFHNVKAGEK